jgi:NTE family protein
MSGRIGLVLSGGAARGAYEAGVVLHLVEEVARDLGRPLPLDILCGTSVGAINACMLAAFADEPVGRGRRLAAHWRGLNMSDLVHPDGRGILDSLRGLFSGQRSPRAGDSRRGGILDPKGIERLVERFVPFRRIGENIQAGHLQALTVSTTHVGSGRTTVFIEQGEGPRYSSSDPTVVGVPTLMSAEHALASAAIPFLFPAVRIDGEFYCDGGLRQNVPLAPALRLGASRLLVVSPRHMDANPQRALEAEREQEFPGPFFLLGKALNSLLLDRIDNDLIQLERINKVLNAGVSQYGASFLDVINRELGVPAIGPRMRPVQTVMISASQDIGVLAAEYVRSPGFAKRVSGVAGRLVRRIGEVSGAADLLSYLLFDGEFAAQLIELGRADARARHAELCALFAELTDDVQAAA